MTSQGQEPPQRVFRLNPARPGHNCWRLQLAQDHDWRRLASLSGPTTRSRADEWEPLDVYEAELPADGARVMTLLSPAVPAFAEATAERLRPILEKWGELLPLSSDVGQPYAFHVTHVVDGLSMFESGLPSHPNASTTEIIRPVVREPDVAALGAFRLRNDPEAVFISASIARAIFGESRLPSWLQAVEMATSEPEEYRTTVLEAGVYRWRTTSESALRVQLSLPSGVNDVRFFHQLSGQSVAETWVPPKAHVVSIDERGDDLLYTDSPSCTCPLPLVSERLRLLSGDYLARFGEMLPLDCDEGGYYLYNVTETVDALDEGASQILRFKSGKPMHIESYAFVPDRVEDAGFFRLDPRWPASPVFATARAANKILQAGAVRVRFSRAWSNGGSPASEA